MRTAIEATRKLLPVRILYVLALAAVVFATTGSNPPPTNGAVQRIAGSRCSGRVVDLRTDRANCGACGHDCGPGALTICSNGSCASRATCPGNVIGTEGGVPIPRPFLPCGDRCVDSRVDPDNCGACGVHVSAGMTCCSGASVDEGTDASNCGACGRKASVANGTAACRSGASVVATCNAGFANCDGSDADGCEIDTGNDAAHCGSCSHACAAGQSCCASGCVNAQGFQTDAANCGSCGNRCGSGQVCVSGGCCGTPTITSAQFNQTTATTFPKGMTAVIDWAVPLPPPGCGAETLSVVGRNDQGAQTASWTSAPFNPGQVNQPVPPGTGTPTVSGLIYTDGTGAHGSISDNFPLVNTSYALTFTCASSHLFAATMLRYVVVDTRPTVSLTLAPAHTPSPPAAYIPVGGQVTVDVSAAFFYGCKGPAQVVIDGRAPAAPASRFHQVTTVPIDPSVGVTNARVSPKLTVSMDTFTDFTATASCANGWSTTTPPARVQLFQSTTAPSSSCSLQCFKVSSAESGICSLLQWCVPSNVSNALGVVQTANPSASVTKVSNCYDYSVCGGL